LQAPKISDTSTLPLLFGVPCTIKDTFEFEGMPQAVGMVSRKDIYGQHDAYAVAALRKAGAIPLGVTNTPELAMWYETYNRVYGRTKNAYDRGRITGGSSGGEGAIVGSGASPFGLGSDVAGSIRMPAFFNGVFGHKASPLLIENQGHFPSAHGQTLNYLSSGPLCRQAEDLEPLVRLLAGSNSHKLKSVKDVEMRKLRVMTIAPERGPKATFDILDAQQRAVDALVVDCAIVNAMELPATAVPMGLNAGGIPTGIQVVSNQNNDHLSIACALALEQATGGWIPPWRSWLADLPETIASFKSQQSCQKDSDSR
jgi:fatty acid amide hydrolase 2